MELQEIKQFSEEQNGLIKSYINLLPHVANP